jgi:hypothetical protein
MGGQVGVFGGGQDGAMAEDFLDFEQVDARLDQVGRITVTKAVRGASRYTKVLVRTPAPLSYSIPIR